MSRLPYDYSRCASPDGCPLANTCRRALDPGRPDGNQSYTVFPGGKDCYGYIGSDEN